MKDPREWPEIICVLCGLIVIFDAGGSTHSYPAQCAANGNGAHVSPDSPAAERAKELRAAWLRDPFGGPTR